VRNLRRDANEAVKKLVKDKLASEDESAAPRPTSRSSPTHVATIDQLVAAKEQEVMAV
jgi:ribosome recycling factor